MKRMLPLLFSVLILPAGADPVVSDVVASQRWPWSEKVDVDFVLTGGSADVDVTATWDGLSAPVLLGTLFAAMPGTNRFTWDPAASTWSNRTLTGFSVTLVPASVAAHTYLVIDLEKGGCGYLADVPSGGWSDDYKTKKMVFRRVPAGTYQLGLTGDEAERFCPDTKDDEKRKRGSRTQTFGSDFYLAVFQMTAAQYGAVVGETDDSLLPKKITYDELRGPTNGTDGICWPTTRYAVATDSFLGKLRRRAIAGLVIDLPTEEQWEVAARARTSSVFPNGGSTTNENAALWAVYDRSSWYYVNGGTEPKDVGLRDPDNDWGFYDMLANRLEWTLDVWYVDKYGRPIKPPAGTDSVGHPTWQDTVGVTTSSYIAKINAAYGQRTARSAYPYKSAVTSLATVLPSARNPRSAQSTECTARLCIHLNPLGFK